MSIQSQQLGRSVPDRDRGTKQETPTQETRNNCSKIQRKNRNVYKLSPSGRLSLLSARPALYLRKRSPDGSTPN